MKKRKIKETLGYDPLSKMMSSGELPPMHEDSASRDESPSHDISFVNFIDNLLDSDVDNRAAKGRRAQADMLKKLSQKKENSSQGNAFPARDLPRSTADVLALSEVYEHLLTPILIVDKNACVVSVNRQARAWFSCDESEVLGESVHRLFKAALGDGYDLNNHLSLPLFKSFTRGKLAIDLSVSRLPRGDGELLFQWCDNAALEQSKKQNDDSSVLLAAANDRLEKQGADLAKQLAASQLASRADLDRLNLVHETKQKQQNESIFDLLRFVFKQVEDGRLNTPIDAAAHPEYLSTLVEYSSDFMARLNHKLTPIHDFLSQFDFPRPEKNKTLWQQTETLITRLSQMIERNDMAYRRSESVINKVTQLLLQLTDKALSHRDEQVIAVSSGLQKLLSGREQDLSLLDGRMVKLSQAAECLSVDCDSHSASLTSSQKNQTQLKGTSQSIEEIAGVIDALAFQTNMLALNAAVEAARAGEEGRGFAIIASEVKRVSKNSASIAKDIKAVLSKNDEYLKNSDRLVIEADSAVAQMKADIAAFQNEFITATQAAEKIASGLGLMRNHIDDLSTVPDSNTELEHQLNHLVARLQRYIDDVAD